MRLVCGIFVNFSNVRSVFTSLILIVVRLLSGVIYFHLVKSFLNCEPIFFFFFSPGFLLSTDLRVQVHYSIHKYIPRLLYSTRRSLPPTAVFYIKRFFFPTFFHFFLIFFFYIDAAQYCVNGIIKPVRIEQRWGACGCRDDGGASSRTMDDRKESKTGTIELLNF